MLVVGRQAQPCAGAADLSERPRHVAQVGQGAREMAVFDVEMQVAVVAALDRLHEVGEVLLVRAARPGAERIAVVVEGRAGRVVRRDGEALRAIPDVGRALERLHLRKPERDGRLDRQAADVGNQECVIPLEDRHLAVGDVAVVDVAEPAAQAHDPPGKLLLAEAPPCLVELVRILVAEVAVAGEMVPVPVVVQPLPRGHDGRRRPGPEVEVEARRKRGWRVDEADGGARLEADRVGDLHGPEPAAFDEVECLPHAGHAAALHAHLAHPVELPRPLRDHAALLHVVAAGLFHVDILARLHRPDGHYGMPVIGCRD